MPGPIRTQDFSRPTATVAPVLAPKDLVQPETEFVPNSVLDTFTASHETTHMDQLSNFRELAKSNKKKAVAPKFTSYTVQKGDNLFKILKNAGYARKDITPALVKQIAKDSNLKNPNLIFPNQKINLPLLQRGKLAEVNVSADEPAPQLIQSEPTKLSTEITPQRVEKLPTNFRNASELLVTGNQKQPTNSGAAKVELIETAPTQLATEITPQKVETLPTPRKLAVTPQADKPQEKKTVLTREEFLKQNSGRTISAKSKLPGRAYLDRADLNYDGVISGDEWKHVFKQVDQFDRNGDRKSVDSSTSETRIRNGKKENMVESTLTNIANAKNGAKAKPTYNARVRKEMSDMIAGKGTSPRYARKLGGGQDYLGREFSKNSVMMSMETEKGSGVEVIYDKGRYFKRLNSSAPAVPVTQAELKSLRQGLESRSWNPDEQDHWLGGDGLNNDAFRTFRNGLYPKR